MYSIRQKILPGIGRVVEKAAPLPLGILAATSLLGVPIATSRTRCIATAGPSSLSGTDDFGQPR